MNNQAVAQLTGVTHRYRKTLALNDIDLNIPAGCMAGLIGPDGVGKSSLMALVAGVRKIQQGHVSVFGHDMSKSHHRSRVCPRIAYMPQGLGKNLYMTLSVFDNIDFFGRLFGHAEKERRWRIDELLESTGLAPFRDRPAGKLSGGMKQKLGLCCALIHDPDFLILDEPTTGVDPLSRRQFWALIERIRSRREGMSVLVATAYMDKNIKWVKNPQSTLIILFTVVVLLSSLFAFRPELALPKFYIVLNWLILYFLIVSVVNTEKRFLIFMLLFLLMSFKIEVKLIP